MEWSSQLHPIFAAWVGTLTVEDQEALLASIRVLERLGPALGRPLVDTVKRSRHKNMKELRPPSSGSSEIRVLFAFDPNRQAILLVGGDKATNWRGWYEVNVPVADERYDEHLAGLSGPPTKASQEGTVMKRLR
jgi:hypothetical protein